MDIYTQLLFYNIELPWTFMLLLLCIFNSTYGGSSSSLSVHFQFILQVKELPFSLSCRCVWAVQTHHHSLYRLSLDPKKERNLQPTCLETNQALFFVVIEQQENSPQIHSYTHGGNSTTCDNGIVQFICCITDVSNFSLCED